MIINKTEADFLFKEKIREGKGELVAGEEIARDKECVKETKEIIRFKKKMVNAELQGKKQKDKAFKKAFKHLTQDETIRSSWEQKKFNSMRIIHKRRVFTALQEAPSNRKQLCLNCCMKLEAVNEALLLLKQEGLIDEEEINARETRYFLKR